MLFPKLQECMHQLLSMQYEPHVGKSDNKRATVQRGMWNANRMAVAEKITSHKSHQIKVILTLTHWNTSWLSWHHMGCLSGLELDAKIILIDLTTRPSLASSYISDLWTHQELESSSGFLAKPCWLFSGWPGLSCEGPQASEWPAWGENTWTCVIG